MALPVALIMGGLNFVGDAAKAEAEARLRMISIAITGGIGILTLIFTVLQ